MEQKGFEDIIAFAIEKEDEAAAFYLEASQRAGRPPMKTAFQNMAREERKHKELLTSLDPEKVAGRTIKAVPDLKIGDYLVDIPYSPDMAYQDILILAMKREKKAFQMYSDIADQTNDPEMKRLFQVLAQEEAKHKLKLEIEYEDNVMEGY